jgi:cytidylate kinase
LGYRYLDTGAMYRAVTWAAVEAGLDPDDSATIGAWITGPEAPTIRSGTDPQSPTIAVDGTDVSAPIRGAEVTANVSAVSAVPQVRTLLVESQRAEAAAAVPGIVLEGRDIGSVVLPDADVKIFLTADPAVRAQRRAAEVEPDSDAAAIAATEQSLRARDTKDSTRALSPLTKADGAVEVDTTHLSFDEVVATVIDVVKEREPSR